MAGSELSRRFANIKETLFQVGAAKDKIQEFKMSEDFLNDLAILNKSVL